MFVTLIDLIGDEIYEVREVRPVEVLRPAYGVWHHIDWFFKTVLETKYPFFEWKDQVYEVDYTTRSYRNTGIKFSRLIDADGSLFD